MSTDHPGTVIRECSASGTWEYGFRGLEMKMGWQLVLSPSSNRLATKQAELVSECSI